MFPPRISGEDAEPEDAEPCQPPRELHGEERNFPPSVFPGFVYGTQEAGDGFQEEEPARPPEVWDGAALCLYGHGTCLGSWPLTGKRVNSLHLTPGLDWSTFSQNSDGWKKGIFVLVRFSWGLVKL